MLMNQFKSNNSSKNRQIWERLRMKNLLILSYRLIFRFLLIILHLRNLMSNQQSKSTIPNQAQSNQQVHSPNNSSENVPATQEPLLKTSSAVVPASAIPKAQTEEQPAQKSTNPQPNPPNLPSNTAIK